MKKIIAAIVAGLCFGAIVFAEADPRIEQVTLDEPFTARWNGQYYVRWGANGTMELSENAFDYVQRTLPIRYIPHYGNGVNLLVAETQENTPIYYIQKHPNIMKNSPMYVLDESYNVIDTIEFNGYLFYLGYRDGYHYLRRGVYVEPYENCYYKTANGVDWIEIEMEEAYTSETPLENGYKLTGRYENPEDWDKPQAELLAFLVDKEQNEYPIIWENGIYTGAGEKKRDLIRIFMKDEETGEERWKLTMDGIYGVEFPEDANGTVWNNDEYVYVGKQVMVTEPRTQYYRLPMSALQNNIIVRLQDKILGFETPPVVEDDYTLVPMRFLFEQMGAEVEWNQQTKTATLHRQGDAVTFTVDNKTATVNGAPKTMAVPARLVNDKTMVPLRFLSEELGMTVEWDNETRTAIIA